MSSKKNRVQVVNTTKGLIKLKLRDKDGKLIKISCMPGAVTKIKKVHLAVLKNINVVQCLFETKKLVVGSMEDATQVDLPKGFKVEGQQDLDDLELDGDDDTDDDTDDTSDEDKYVM